MSADRPGLPPTIQTAEARSRGLRPEQLLGGGLVRVRRGLWGVPGIDPGDPDVRIAAVGAQLPEHAVVGGWAAARLHERAAAVDDLVVFDGAAPWDDEVRPDSTCARVLVCAARESRLDRRSDVRIFRSSVPECDRMLAEGIRISGAARAAFDMARLLATERAVVGVDRLLHLGAVTTDDLARYARGCGHLRGAAVARRRFALADAGAESPQETVLRLLWLGAGLPRPRCNVVVRDDAGRFVARTDLIDARAGVVAEYDGAEHSSAARRSDDARRQEELEALGLVVVRATAVDVRSASARRAWQDRLRWAYLRAESGAAPRRWAVEARATT